MQSYSTCLLTTIDWNSSKFLNDKECLLLDSHLPGVFCAFTPFSSFSRALLSPPVLPDLFPLLCCQCCRSLPHCAREKNTAEGPSRVQVAQKCLPKPWPGFNLHYFPPKPLHHNPCWIWYWDSCGSKSMKALVNGWVQVTPTSVPSYLKTWRCSRIYAGCGDDIPSPGRCPLGQKPTLQLQVLSAMLYLLPSLWRSRLCTDTLCVFRKPH